MWELPQQGEMEEQAKSDGAGSQANHSLKSGSKKSSGRRRRGKAKKPLDDEQEDKTIDGESELSNLPSAPASSGDLPQHTTKKKLHATANAPSPTPVLAVPNVCGLIDQPAPAPPLPPPPPAPPAPAGPSAAPEDGDPAPLYLTRRGQIQLELEEQWRKLLKANKEKMLTLEDVARFTTFLLSVRQRLVAKAGALKRRHVALRARLRRAPRDKIDRLYREMLGVEAQESALHADVAVFNRLQVDFKASPAYRAMLDFGARNMVRCPSGEMVLDPDYGLAGEDGDGIDAAADGAGGGGAGLGGPGMGAQPSLADLLAEFKMEEGLTPGAAGGLGGAGGGGGGGAGGAAAVGAGGLLGGGEAGLAGREEGPAEGEANASPPASGTGGATGLHLGTMAWAEAARAECEVEAEGVACSLKNNSKKGGGGGRKNNKKKRKKKK